MDELAWNTSSQKGLAQLCLQVIEQVQQLRRSELGLSKVVVGMKVKIVKVKVNLSEEWSVVHHVHQLLPLIVLLQHHDLSMCHAPSPLSQLVL